MNERENNGGSVVRNSGGRVVRVAVEPPPIIVNEGGGADLEAGMIETSQPQIDYVDDVRNNDAPVVEGQETISLEGGGARNCW